MAALLHDHAGSCACSAGRLFRPLAEPTRSDSAWARSLSDRTPSVLSALRPPTPRPPIVPTIADHIYVGTIATLSSNGPAAVEAIAVSDGVITAMGTSDELDGLVGPGTQVHRLGGEITYPGLIEPHMHYWPSAFQLDWVDCSTRGGTTFDTIVDRLRNAAPVQGEWVLGTQFDPSLLPGETNLTRDVLDAAVPDRPVLVMNASMHFVYVNSKAFELAGIDDTTPDPPGGFYERANGRLTGVVGEGAAIGRLILSVPPAGRDHLLDAVVRINHTAAAAGYTRTHDAMTGIILGADEITAYHELADRFRARITYAISDYAADAAIAHGLVPFAGDDRCRATSWKIVTDGSNQGRSGYQRDDYVGTDRHGHANYATDDLVARMRLAIEHGWPIMTHANGDAAIDQTIDAYAEALGGTSGLELRHRIEHCSFAHLEQLDRMAALGLSPSFLIGHVYYWGDAFAERIVGRDKAQLLDPVASAVARGLRATIHSDYTVTDIEPFRELQTAVTRSTRSGGTLNAAEAVDIDAALRMKTIDAAWQTHCDDVAGSIEVGKHADLVVLDTDPRTADPSEIAATGVLRTIVGGETVYEA